MNNEYNENYWHGNGNTAIEQILENRDENRLFEIGKKLIILDSKKKEIEKEIESLVEERQEIYDN